MRRFRLLRDISSLEKSVPASRAKLCKTCNSSVPILRWVAVSDMALPVSIALFASAPSPATPADTPRNPNICPPTLLNIPPTEPENDLAASLHLARPVLKPAEFSPIFAKISLVAISYFLRFRYHFLFVVRQYLRAALLFGESRAIPKQLAERHIPDFRKGKVGF